MSNSEFNARFDNIFVGLSETAKRAVMVSGIVGARVAHRGGTLEEMTAAMKQAGDDLQNATPDEITARFTTEVEAARREGIPV